MCAMNFDKVYPIISYLYSDLSSDRKPIVFWTTPRESIFDKNFTTIYLYHETRTENGMDGNIYLGRLNGISRHHMRLRISIPEDGNGESIFPLQRINTDIYPPITYSCNMALGTLYPISIYVSGNETVVYASETQEFADSVLKKFPSQDYTNKLFSSEQPVEFIGVVKKGNVVTDIHELDRITSTGEERRKEILKAMAHNKANGWNFILLEMIEPNSLYRPNIVMWFCKEEEGIMPYVKFHMLDS